MPETTQPIVIQIECLGLGYPPGYKLQVCPIHFDLNGTNISIWIETPDGHWHLHHRDQDETPEEYEIKRAAGCCEPGRIGKSFFMVVDAEELDPDKVLAEVRRWLAHFDVKYPGELQFDPAHNFDTEIGRWREDEEGRLQWLARGAPPYGVAFEETAVEDLAAIHGESKADTEEKLEAMGYKRANGGELTRKPPLGSPEWRDEYEQALRELAEKHGDTGNLYIAAGTWPTSIGIVAGGKRYPYSLWYKEEPGRAWFAYMQGTRQVVIFETKEKYETIRVKANPDFLPALFSL